VFVNTGRELMGVIPVGWGKIRIDAKPIEVLANASLVFPLIVSQMFPKQKWKESVKDCVCWIEDS